MDLFIELKERHDYVPPEDYITRVLPPEAFADSRDIPEYEVTFIRVPLYELRDPVDKGLMRKRIEEQRRREAERRRQLEEEMRRWEEEEEEEEEDDDDDFLRMSQQLSVICSESRGKRGDWPNVKATRRGRRRTHTKETPYNEDEEENLSELELAVENTRRRIHQCNCNHIPRHTLFTSHADVEELFLPFKLEEPYLCFASRCQKSAPSYAHFFPDFNRSPLMDTVECGNTEDTVLAKAITIATQSYQKMLYFQIEAAVQDCLELLKEMERMNDRYDFYHFIASEILFNNKSYEDVLKLIRDGHVELHYTLKEFSTPHADHHMEDLVHRLVGRTRAYMPTDAQRECGMFKDWVCQQVDKEYESLGYLYMHFLDNKMRAWFAPFPEVLKDLKYSETHEWVSVEGDYATIGISDHAQEHLGYVASVELPEVGQSVSQGNKFGAVVSVKGTTRRINSPVSGEVVEVNDQLSDLPGLVNARPYETGWIIVVKISDSGELNSLMNDEDYSKFCKEGRKRQVLNKL
uniref:Lipoyl-binding domain-containing protein n=1 Tax=Oryza barthii TaxID=65489 RepID=A0A0D3F189_9ORYZ